MAYEFPYREIPLEMRCAPHPPRRRPRRQPRQRRHGGHRPAHFGIRRTGTSFATVRFAAASDNAISIAASERWINATLELAA